MDVDHELLATKLKELGGLLPDSRDLLRLPNDSCEPRALLSVEPQFVTIEGHWQWEFG